MSERSVKYTELEAKVLRLIEEHGPIKPSTLIALIQLEPFTRAVYVAGRKSMAEEARSAVYAQYVNLTNRGDLKQAKGAMACCHALKGKS